jgi:mono/diheme cytochrome c family protein
MPPAVARQMTSRRMRAFPLLGLVGALLLLLGGCESKKPDLAKGKQLFVQNCGSCHQLADANTKGTIGPNLDDSFRQAVADGLGRDTIEGVVKEQIAFPQGGQMPANLVKGDDRDAVAYYVGKVAGKGATGSTGPSGGGPSGTAKANSKNELEIPTDPTGQLAFKFKSATAKAGKVTLLSKNDSPVPHDISIKDGVDTKGKLVKDGGTSKVTVRLKPRTYTFYCSVPGHEQAGMKGTLTVK